MQPDKSDLRGLLVEMMAGVLERDPAEVSSLDSLRALAADSIALVVLADLAEEQGIGLSDELLKTAKSITELAAGAELVERV